MQDVTLGQLGGWIAFAVSIFGGFSFFYKPVRKIIDQIEDHEEKLHSSAEDRKDLRELMTITLVSVKALLKDGIEDGKNKDEMIKAYKGIDECLIKHANKGR